jgi:hypothetical protein
MKTHGGMEVWLQACLISALVGGEWSHSHPGRFTSAERGRGILWLGGWVRVRAGLDVVDNT